ncbi:hypothetical protein AB0M44_08520 [Streptosporangium subroseum]|uniref:hypothetical protein n=1 Tax=Streptosporangium subroseum TaxID=106412 RepID=UPI003433A05B
MRPATSCRIGPAALSITLASAAPRSMVSRSLGSMSRVTSTVNTAVRARMGSPIITMMSALRALARPIPRREMRSAARRALIGRSPGWRWAG